MASQEQITLLLQPWLGTAFLQCSGLAQQVTACLNCCDITHSPIASLLKSLDEMIFRSLRDSTHGDMRVLLDDGRTMRVRVDDVDAMADEALYFALQLLPRNPEQYQRLRQFAMTHESLSALRALSAFRGISDGGRAGTDRAHRAQRLSALSLAQLAAVMQYHGIC